MKVRSYNESKDFDLYLEAERESFRATYPGVSILKEMESYFRCSIKDSFELNDCKGFTLEDESEEVVGMFILSMNGFYNIPMGYIDNIYIQESSRGAGALGLLLSTAEKCVLDMGFGMMQLDVSVLNEQALNAYKKMGYITVRQCMEKKL